MRVDMAHDDPGRLAALLVIRARQLVERHGDYIALADRDQLGIEAADLLQTLDSLDELDALDLADTLEDRRKEAS